MAEYAPYSIPSNRELQMIFHFHQYGSGSWALMRLTKSAVRASTGLAVVCNGTMIRNGSYPR